MSKFSLDLHHGALAAIAGSSIEVFPKETAGLVFGIIDGPKIQCVMSQPIQDADRALHAVSWDPRVHERLKRSIMLSTGFRFLGIFHSHPYSTVELTQDDSDFMKENDCALNLIISLRPKGTDYSGPWVQDGFQVKGFVHGFEVSVGGFYLHNQKAMPTTTNYLLMDVANLLQDEFGMDLYRLSTIQDQPLVLLHYWLDKIEYHVRRDKGDYGRRKIDYAISKIKQIIQPIARKSSLAEAVA